MIEQLINVLYAGYIGGVLAAVAVVTIHAALDRIDRNADY